MYETMAIKMHKIFLNFYVLLRFLLCCDIISKTNIVGL